MNTSKLRHGLRYLKHWLGGLALLACALGAQAVSPPAPLTCTTSAGTYTQSTPVAIPTGPGVVSSTLVVSGAGPYLWDVDVRTFLRHAFAADLDVTITSPAGTVVTLTTDNGAGNDDVFNGTLWDDSAGDTVTDHVYANLVLASPLVPEEPLSAFLGENPNGTWTITISDDLAGDGGSLDSWSLAITTLPAAPTTQTFNFTQASGTPIPDPGTATSPLMVAGAGSSLLNVRVTTFIGHTFAGDLDITLRSPPGTVTTLSTDNGGGADNVFNGTLWDDQANPGGQVPYTSNNGLVTDHVYANNVVATPLAPEGALGAFRGENPNGQWQLIVTDDAALDTGTIDSWSIEVTTASCGAALVAGADSGSATTAGGMAVADVRANDTVAGAAATSANSTIATQGAWPAGITLSTTTGAVQVAAGTPAGTYVLTYRLTDSANPANFVDATVTVTVTAALVAGADSGTTTTAGGTAVADVRANDTVAGAPATAANSTIAMQGAWPAGITLSPAGAVLVASGTPAGSYVMTYRLTDSTDPANFVDATVTVNVGTTTPVPADAPWALLLGALGLLALARRRWRG